MDYNREILIETAEELKEAVEKAERVIEEAKQKANEKAGIIGYSGAFQIYDEDLFLNICVAENKVPKRKLFIESFKYIYSIEVEGHSFIHISNKELDLFEEGE